MSALVHRLALVGLGPLIILQGAYTRIVTPRLPEPQGERRGRAGAGPVLRLLIAGDSGAAGVGVIHQRAALSGQLVAALGPSFDLRWELIATSGFTTWNLLRRLEQEPSRTFDVAVISLGVNDVTTAVRVKTWLDQQVTLVKLLVQRFGVKHIILSGLPPMDQMEALPQPLRWLLALRARRFDTARSLALTATLNCEVLPLAISAHPDALASDGFHPGWETYRCWAAALATRIVDFSQGLDVHAKAVPSESD